MARIHIESLRSCLGNKKKDLEQSFPITFKINYSQISVFYRFGCSCRAGKYYLLRDICCFLSELT